MGGRGGEWGRTGNNGHKALVSEPNPRKIRKEGLVNEAGWKCTLRNVRNFITLTVT